LSPAHPGRVPGATNAERGTQMRASGNGNGSGDDGSGNGHGSHVDDGSCGRSGSTRAGGDTRGRGCALVLGGRGFTAIAWQIGVLKGLADAGCDLAAADTIVGTSAGAVLGARIAAGERWDALFDQETSGAAYSPDLHIGLGLTARYLWAALGSRSSQRSARRLGRFARVAVSLGEDDVLAEIDRLLPVADWPDRRLTVAAVDADTGEVGAFDRAGAVELRRAVAASGAVPGIWPPIAALGKHRIDGGVRSGANPALAAGHDRAVVLAPIPKVPGPHRDAAADTAALVHTGVRAVLLIPDPVARRAFGRDPLDAARRPAAAEAGRVQGAARAAEAAAVWQQV
jgi:NTE family protein